MFFALSRTIFLLFSLLAVLAESQQSLFRGLVSVIRLTVLPSVCLSVRKSFPCLRDKVYIFGRIFVKIHIVHLINSYNPIDFEKNLTISKGKVAI